MTCDAHRNPRGPFAPGAIASHNVIMTWMGHPARTPSYRCDYIVTIVAETLAGGGGAD